jgi:hypothetical protein
MKHTCIIVACALSLLIGAVFGFHYSRYSERAGAKFLEFQSHATFMRSQNTSLRSSDSLILEAAPWRQIEAMEADGRSLSPKYSEASRAKDTVIAYARLAQLASRGSSDDRVTRLLAAGAFACPKTGWVDCSPPRIKFLGNEWAQLSNP